MTFTSVQEFALVEPQEVAMPPDKRHTFSDLSPEAQDFLIQLRESDIAAIEEGLRMVAAMRTLGRVTRWMFLGIVSAFVGAATLADSVGKLWASLTGRGH